MSPILFKPLNRLYDGYFSLAHGPSIEPQGCSLNNILRVTGSYLHNIKIIVVKNFIGMVIFIYRRN